ncbi:MAG: catechol 2,3-dioxygenase-like lactoylglutathione lyase family enzyme [Candidatus Poriferisodalaceae bacterium]|jgi:catechol 2,3-dioxygenase-like lactoylglutathione lyase family enzyme
MGHISGLDHVAITVDDPEVTMAFYRDVLGAEVHKEDEWRTEGYPIYGLQVGSNRINVHDEERDKMLPPTLKARLPTPGSGDICFRWVGSIESAIAYLADHDVEVIFGPAERDASDGTQGMSVYFNDPDGNLLEFLTID